MVNFLKPFQVLWSGTKVVLKGMQWGLNRPEAEFVCLALPFFGAARAAILLKTMIQAEDKFTDGSLKLSWVLKQLITLEAAGHIDLKGITQKQLVKEIAMLVPIAEGQGLLLIGEADEDAD